MSDSGKRPPLLLSAAACSGSDHSTVQVAAEYLGQDAVQLAANLPAEFIEENIVKEKKKNEAPDISFVSVYACGSSR